MGPIPPTVAKPGFAYRRTGKLSRDSQHPVLQSFKGKDSLDMHVEGFLGPLRFEHKRRLDKLGVATESPLSVILFCAMTTKDFKGYACDCGG